MLVGLLIGISVNFRLPNLFLSAGYCLLSRRRIPAGAKQGHFPAGCDIRRCIPDRDGADAGRQRDQCGQSVRDHLRRPIQRFDAPGLDAGILWRYFIDVQFTLLTLAGAWTAWLLRLESGAGIRSVALVTAPESRGEPGFLHDPPDLHAVLHIPIDMLSLWTLLFASLMRPAESGDGRLAGQASEGLEAPGYRPGVDFRLVLIHGGECLVAPVRNTHDTGQEDGEPELNADRNACQRDDEHSQDDGIGKRPEIDGSPGQERPDEAGRSQPDDRYRDDQSAFECQK